MKTILVYSGGLDSTVLLYHLLEAGHQVKALSVNYGQRHIREIHNARHICRLLDIEHRIALLTSITDLISASSQTGDKEVPEGHYAEESMKQTVVPNRNMIMLSIAIGWAVNLEYDQVAFAAHAGDHAIYPDCRPEFAKAMDDLAQIANWHPVSIARPFIGMSKADIVKEGARLRVPFAETWSCYKGADRHCGKCGTCYERLEAFELAGVRDPVEYDSSDSLRSQEAYAASDRG